MIANPPNDGSLWTDQRLLGRRGVVEQRPNDDQRWQLPTLGYLFRDLAEFGDYRLAL